MPNNNEESPKEYYEKTQKPYIIDVSILMLSIAMVIVGALYYYGDCPMHYSLFLLIVGGTFFILSTLRLILRSNPKCGSIKNWKWFMTLLSDVATIFACITIFPASVILRKSF